MRFEDYALPVVAGIGLFILLVGLAMIYEPAAFVVLGMALVGGALAGAFLRGSS